MRILALDPGTHCGWALRDPDGTMTSGVWDLSVGRHESAGMRFIRLRGWLNEVYNATPFIVLAYEEVARHSGTHAAHIYGGIVATIQTWATDLGTTSEPDDLVEYLLVEHIGIPVGTVKKFATGKGNANKSLMMVSALDRWCKDPDDGYWEPVDDNEVDARWIAECCAHQLENV